MAAISKFNGVGKGFGMSRQRNFWRFVLQIFLMMAIEYLCKILNSLTNERIW